MCDSNDDQEMESCYHQNNSSDDDDGDISRNLMDFYLYKYDKWQQERDPVEIDQQVAQLSDEFPDFKPQMIKNVLQRDDVKRDLKKARQLIEEFRVMREQDQKRSQQNREPRKNHETNSGDKMDHSSRGGKRGGNPWKRGRDWGRGRGRNQHGMMAYGNSSERGTDRMEVSTLQENPAHQRSPYESLNSNSSRGRGNFRNQRNRQHGRGNAPGRGGDRMDEDTLEDKFAHQRSSNESLNSNYSRGRGNFRNQRNRQRGRGNSPGGGGDRMDENTLEDKFAHQRSSNESLNSNSSSGRRNSRNKRNRRNKRGWGNVRGRGRGRNDGHYSQEAPGALETIRKAGEGLPCDHPRGRMGRAQSFAAFEQLMAQQQSHEEKFEPNMLCVRGLSDRTTDEGLTNFIEAKSGDEVLEVVMFGNGKALVVLKNLTDFKRTKQKAEQKYLDGAQLEIRRVEVCQTICVSGLSKNTTHDALELYFENTKRSGGGTVKGVDYNSGDNEALVHFDTSEVVEKVLAKEQALNDAKLVVRKYYPDLEEEDSEEDDVDKATHSVNQSRRKPLGKKPVSDKSRETTTGQQLSITVEPEKMECITISGERKKLDDTLEEQNCTLRWNPGEKFVLVLYRGQAPHWQHKCIETINNCLDGFVSRTIEIDGNYSEGVVARLPEIRKAMEDRKIVVEAAQQSEKHCLRMTCKASQAIKNKEEICKLVRVISNEEEKKTYKSTTIPDIPEENIALLKKIKFFDKLKLKSKDLQVNIDEENGSVHLEGPPEQFKEAVVSIRRQINQLASRTVPATSNALKILSNDSGLDLVKLELHKNDLDAVFVFDPETKEACVVGKSSAEAEKAVDVIKNMILEQKIKVEKESLPMLTCSKWKELVEGVPKKFGILIHRNEYGDTWVTGFRQDVYKAVEEFKAFLDEHTERREVFTSDKLLLRYLQNYKKDALSSIEASLAQFNVKIKTGSDEGNLIISGTKKSLEQVRSNLHTLTTSVVADVHEVKQPGVKRLFTNWGGASLVRSVEREHSCIIEIERKFDLDPRRSSASSPEPSMSSDECEDVSSDDGGSVGSGSQTFLTGHTGTSVKTGMNHITITTAENKTISWKIGDITREQADVLVASVARNLDLTAGPFARAFSNAAGPELQQACSASVNLGIGEVLMTVPGDLPCAHVMLAACCNWDNGSGAAESVLRKLVKKSLEQAHRLGVGSIAFPTLGTGNLKFPWSIAAGVLTDEAIAFSQRYSSSPLGDIRVIVFEKDQKSIKEFQSDIRQVQLQQGTRGTTRLSAGSVNPGAAQGAVLVEIIQGDITQETTDVIVNVNGTNMNMNSAGAVSKEIARASGSSVEQECLQKGQQTPGAVVMTGAGNLLANCIIHLVPGGGGRDHLEQSVEDCLNMADANGYNSISFPAVGTGNAAGDPLQSARSMLRAVSNFSKTSPQNINHIRIVIFQGHMVSVFQQEHQRMGLGTSTTSIPFPSPKAKSKPRVKTAPLKPVSIRHGACARLHIYGQDKMSVGRIIKALEKTFADALTKQKVEDEALNFLSERQVKHLEDKATKLDLDIEVEPRVSRIVVSGNPKDVTEMMRVVWEEIDKCKERKRKKERAQLVAKNVQWYYKLNSTSHKIAFDKNSNAEIEVALTQKEKSVTVSVGSEQFVIDIAGKKGYSTRGQSIEIIREMKGTGGEGMDLPSNWSPMTSESVCLVALSPGSAEYQNVETKFRNTGGGGRIISRIERIQNPLLYRSYLVRKQKMDKENRKANNEQELWHGTASKNVKSINEQGFNRSFCGANGTAYGNGVYFARDASYSMGYASGGQMYLARVLVGEYTNGRSGLIVPPSKDPRSPEILFDSVVDNTGHPRIYVVFFDSQCYPEYLITFH